MSSDDEYCDSDDQMSMEDSDEDYGFDNTGEEAAQRKVGRQTEAFSCLPSVAGLSRPVDALVSCLQSKYVVLTKTDILRRQKEAVEQVTSILGISDDDAARVLRKYKW
jgi:hypothetical protein